MNDRVQTAKTIADLAWTALVVAIMAYSFREPIRKAVNEKRSELDATRLAVLAREQAARARAGFDDWTRQRMIANGTDPLIAEIVTAPDAPRES